MAKKQVSPTAIQIPEWANFYGQLSFGQACQIISFAKIVVSRRDGHFLTWEEIWNNSPTGELYFIWEWYPMAIAELWATNYIPTKSLFTNE